ncbi:uncharacterized protein [Leptinotarsa decemlineata]|uniref:uncharacterized protein n=1 Tax=Leptinotarsa decemlineata TaxID=7539 RepID=UPI003D30B3FE
MILDKKLKWEAHLKHVRHSSQSGINLLKTLSNHRWGSDVQTLLLLYRSLIRSIIDYGSIVYDSATRSTLKMMDSIHNTAIRTALGAYRTTPTESLYCESGEPSLYLRREYLSLSYAARISGNHNHPAYNNVFSKRFNNLYARRSRITHPFYQRINLYISKLSPNYSFSTHKKVLAIPPWTIKSPICNLNLPSLDKSVTPPQLIQCHFQVLLSNIPMYTQIYTDASRSEEGVAAAFVTTNSSHKFKVNKFGSIYYGELFAILQALKHILEYDIQNSSVITDSLSAIIGIQQMYSDNQILMNIKEAIYAISRENKNNIFLWVPSHVGI